MTEQNFQASGQTATGVAGGLSGGTSTGMPYQQPYPNVCPGCGRCHVCGHPASPSPYQVPYGPYPYWGGGTAQLNGGDPKIIAINSADVAHIQH